MSRMQELMVDGTGAQDAPAASSEERVRTRAYHLWEEAGRPHGRDAEFWEQARALEQQESTSEAADESTEPKAESTASGTQAAVPQSEAAPGGPLTE